MSNRLKLLDVERTVTAPATDCTDIVPWGLSCLRCWSDDLVEESFDQLPLLRHAGYGASLRSSIRRCRACQFSILVAVSEVRPPHRRPA